MKSEQEQVVSSEYSSTSPTRPLDRRRFMESAALVGATLGLDASIWGAAAAAGASTNSRLPDGTEFVSWEQPLTFSKTYYVDNTAANADDNGPGDRARPFRTINKAAQIAATWRARGHRGRHLPGMRPSGARRRRPDADDQL